MSLFTVIYKPGPRWIAGRRFHEQEGVSGHRDFLAERHAAGDLLVGGPFLDDTGGIAIYEASTDEELIALLQQDKTITGRLMTYELHPCALPFMR